MFSCQNPCIPNPSIVLTPSKKFRNSVNSVKIPHAYFGKASESPIGLVRTSPAF